MYINMQFRWDDNIKVDLREVECGGIDWIDLAEDRDQWKGLVNMAMSLWASKNIAKFLNSRAAGGFSRTAQLHGVS
jgi:hypothetical protein